MLSFASGVAIAAVFSLSAYGHIRRPSELVAGVQSLLHIEGLFSRAVAAGVAGAELASVVLILVGSLQGDQQSWRIGIGCSVALSVGYVLGLGRHVLTAREEACGCGFGDETSERVMLLRPLGVFVLGIVALGSTPEPSPAGAIAGAVLGVLVGLVPSAWAIASKRTRELEAEHLLDFAT